MKKTIIRLTENDLHDIIKNSVKRILTERNHSYIVYGTAIFNPYDYCECEDDEVLLQSLNIQEEYEITFKGTYVHEDQVMYYRDGSGYPGYDGIDDYDVSDDGGFIEAMNVVKNKNPRLYKILYKSFDNIAFDDIEWDTEEDVPDMSDYECDD